MTKQPSVVLIVGDSLSAKRSDGISWECRWPQILAEQLGPDYIVSNRSRGAATSRCLQHQKLDGVSLAIIQLGIVDCVPRYFSRIENAFIAKLPAGLRINVVNYFTSRRVRDKSRAYVGVEEYRRNFEAFLSRVEYAVVVKILEPGEKFCRSNSDAFEFIYRYNQVIDRFVERYDNVRLVSVPLGFVDALTLEDGYHFNKDGHVYVARLLVNMIVSHGFGFRGVEVMQ